MYSFETKSFARSEPADGGFAMSTNSSADLGQPMKRLMDLVLSLFGLIFFAPLLSICCLAIWVETGGPVLFVQKRTGLHGKVFSIYKLRTMTAADDGAAVAQATKGDARVTFVGGFLRKLSIDELPQLVNVLRGDMSLVGPRPHALAHDLHYSALLPQYAERFAVRPGLTGWAQVNGARGETRTVEAMERRIDLDLEYVRQARISLDVKILVLTLLRVPFDRAAY